ncbi:MAG TPA: hypothetical protein VIJ72_07540, partial [Rhizomicrobium sp.]
MDKKQQRLVYLAGGGLAALAVILLAALFVLGGRGTGGGGLMERLQNGLSAMTPAQLAGGPEFAFRRLEIDTSKPQAEACLVFTRTLDASGRTHYEDYFSIDPATRVASRVVDSSLCLSGLSFDKTYSVTLKTGLPDAAGEKLTQDETVPVELRDKPSVVRFTGGILLPRENLAGVPVSTVNVSKLNLKIIRVGDRLLSQ